MKAALITEEQIKQVLDAIETSKPMHDSPRTKNRHNKALAIIQSLKVQEPIGFKKFHPEPTSWDQV